MLTFTMLVITLVILAIAAVLFIGIGGAALVLVFGDVILCGVIIWMIVKFFIKRRKN